MHSPTEMAATALKLALPKLSPSPVTTLCGLCGTLLQADKTPAKPFVPSQEFGAFEHIHPARSALICAPCAVAISSDSGLMTRYSRAIFVEGKALRLSSAEDVGWFVQHAAPPFVAVFNTRSTAHTVWFAPVSYDRVCLSIVVGSMVGSLRPAAVLDARAALSRLAQVGNELLNAKYPWPVFNLSLYDDVTDVCRLIPSHERVLRASEDLTVANDLAIFDSLNATERWALAAILLARPKRSDSVEDFKRPPVIVRAGPPRPNAKPTYLVPKSSSTGSSQ